MHQLPSRHFRSHPPTITSSFQARPNPRTVAFLFQVTLADCHVLTSDYAHRWNYHVLKVSCSIQIDYHVLISGYAHEMSCPHFKLFQWTVTRFYITFHTFGNSIVILYYTIHCNSLVKDLVKKKIPDWNNSSLPVYPFDFPLILLIFKYFISFLFLLIQCILRSVLHTYKV